MTGKFSMVLVMLLVFLSTVFCSLGGNSGSAEAELVASLATATAEAAAAEAEVIEDELQITEPTFTPEPEPTPEPTEEVMPDALTGQAAYDLALAEAQAWQEDATLVSLGTSLLGPLQADGTSESWAVSFWSPSSSEMLSLLFANGKLNTPPAVQMPGNPGTIPALDSVIMEMQGIYETAAGAGGDQFLNEDYYTMAGLTPYPLDKSIPTWYINYHKTQDNTAVYTVIIDARSGEVIQAIDVSGG